MASDGSSAPSPTPPPSNDNTSSNKSIQDYIKEFKTSAAHFDDGLRLGIKKGVQVTNSVLATAEDNSNLVRASLASKMVSVGNMVKTAGTHASDAYDKRHRYGPGIVAGVGASVGAVVAIRRGRVPGLITGGAAGFGAYAGVYGLDGLPPLELPTFGEKKP